MFSDATEFAEYSRIFRFYFIQRLLNDILRNLAPVKFPKHTGYKI